MPANSPALFPSLAGDINNISGDDDDFGDFVFSFPSHAPSSLSYTAPTVLSTADADDDDWGDFVASQLESHSLQPQSSSPFSPPLDPLPPSNKAWVKPKGAIPLSIFGENEDETDSVTMEGSGVFENGIASFSFSTSSSSRPATAGKFSDMIERLYRQIDVGGKEEVDDFDMGSWEFKDAMSIDARPKMEAAGGAVIGLEMVTVANENGSSQAVVDRLENGWEGLEQFNMDGQEREPADVFAAHEKLTNGSLGYNHSVTDKVLHEMLPSFENGTSSSGTSGYKIEFPEYAIINGFKEKIQDDQADLVHPPEKQEDIKEIEWNMWDVDDLNISSYANGKENLNGISEDHTEHNTGAGKMDYSTIALAGIIQNLYEKTCSPRAVLPSQNTINNGEEIDQLGNSSAYVNGDIDFDQLDWQFQSTVETREAKLFGAYESGEGLANASTSYSLVDLYCRLKEESLSLIVHHLVTLKVPALPGVMPEVEKINEEIQEVYGNLQEMIASKDACTGEQITDHFKRLLNVTRASNFEKVEQECHLSERLLAAEKHLNAAVDLFEHSSSVLQILRSTSRAQQLFYINAWSKLASACAEELQLGAKIWTESLNGNIAKQILKKGHKYFLALGEVYRVSKFLKATKKFYRPWLLSNLEYSTEMVSSLEKSKEAWINSGLEEALQSISSNMDHDDNGLAKPLLESINFIDKVDEPKFQDTVFQPENGFCKFSLLPLDKLPGIKTVVWNGNCYIAKIANFWANRISPDPPSLPSIMLS
ncbi:uncharacterized protein LOC110026148 isoform X2 [Phalaenopsis equestris]|uniref:uncharacterized protein LOC110026148 isoform X2 n=1 Tax=Phalaenopsis equestris TaxID=78828 RepID=UPI0009E58237|nr:uncharacterized protein LOC110026148 isoform X2 [Phalaenopsis equestris]